MFDVLLGVCGSISAYKSLDLVSQLSKLQIQTKVVMTEAATHFVTPLSFQTLTGFPVEIESFAPHSAIVHIALARESRLMVIVPATANFIAKMALGLGDDLLSSLVLSTTTPVMVAPAMNKEMWVHRAVQRNLKQIIDDGCIVIPPQTGLLACKEEGIGKLADVSVLVQTIQEQLHLIKG
jgi:phosphopantothenoylcysteine synthetase/decarboxylase